MVAGHHQAALDMLGVVPRRSPERERLIAARERACDAAFPASVVEWFALEESERLFHDNSNEDDLVPLDELGDPDETRQGYLRVAVENQGVVAWYVRLDEGDDPPVYHNNDQFSEGELARIDWVPEAVRFSNFVYDMVSVGRLGAFRSDQWLRADGPVPGSGPPGLRPGPVTHAEQEVRRWFGPHEHVTAAWPPGAATAEWIVAADHPDRLTTLAAELGFAEALAERRRPRAQRGHGGPSPRRQGRLARLLARLRGR